MALYKITSSLTTAINFENKSVPVPSTSELTEEEAAVASKVADLVQVDEDFAKAQPKEEFIVNKKQEEKIDKTLVGDDVEEATPKLNFK